MISQELLKLTLSYNSETGLLTRISKTCGRGTIGKPVGSLNSGGYLTFKLLGKSYQVHRLIFLYLYGYIPSEIDHINGIKTDNRLANLRPCTREENRQNIGLYSNNKTGIKGVFWTKEGCKGQLKVDGIRYYKVYRITKDRTREQAEEEATNWVRTKREQLIGSFLNHGD